MVVSDCPFISHTYECVHVPLSSLSLVLSFSSIPFAPFILCVISPSVQVWVWMGWVHSPHSPRTSPSVVPPCCTNNTKSPVFLCPAVVSSLPSIYFSTKSCFLLSSFLLFFIHNFRIQFLCISFIFQSHFSRHRPHFSRPLTLPSPLLLPPSLPLVARSRRFLAHPLYPASPSPHTLPPSHPPKHQNKPWLVSSTNSTSGTKA
ncbi:MAG: hypothetical protein BYD32DRAFT_407063 [Podila humilis]|nr:MAG: hypothetical protein BYD32DRAFT_407063 [Podila humilis]